MKRKRPMEPHHIRAYKQGLKDACELIHEFSLNYPVEIFPEPEPGCAPDRYSAAMARHVCYVLIKEIRQLDAR